MSRFAPWLCTALALSLAALMPTRAHAHGSEFILAKISTPGDGLLHLQLSADYLGNPMLGTEDAARTALAECLAVRTGAELVPLQKLAPFTFEKRADFDPDSPLPKGPPVPPDPSEKHAVLTASWSWKPTAAAVSLEVPQGVAHSVFAWKHEPGIPIEQVRWKILIAGDQTPEIAIPQPPAPKSQWMPVSIAAFSILLALSPLLKLLRRQTGEGSA